MKKLIKSQESFLNMTCGNPVIVLCNQFTLTTIKDLLNKKLKCMSTLVTKLD